MANQNRPNLGRQGFVGSLGNLADAANFAAKTGVSSLGGIAKGGAKVTGATAQGAGGILSGSVNLVARLIARAPTLSFIAGAYAAMKGGQYFWRKHKEKKAAEAAVVDVNAPPQPMAMQGHETLASPAPGQGVPMQQQGGMGPASQQLTEQQMAFLGKLGQEMPAQAAMPPQGQLRQDWAEHVTNRRQLTAGQGMQNPR